MIARRGEKKPMAKGREPVTKPHEVGGDIESYCTKCRTDTAHVIVALLEEKAKRVVCNICNGEHNYRVPKAQRAAIKAAKKKKAAAKRKTTTRRRRVVPKTPAEQAAADASSVEEWTAKLREITEAEIVDYKLDGIYHQKDLIQHPTFGLGFIEEVQRHRAHVVFLESKKLLICQDAKKNLASAE